MLFIYIYLQYKKLLHLINIEIMKTYSKLALILLILITLSNCMKVEEDIVGTWTLIDMGDERFENITWKFSNDGNLIRVKEMEEGYIIDSCTYEVDQSLLRKHISVYGSKIIPERDSISGKYTVDELTDKILIITRIELSNGSTGGAYYRCEFTRN